MIYNGAFGILRCLFFLIGLALIYLWQNCINGIFRFKAAIKQHHNRAVDV